MSLIREAFTEEQFQLILEALAEKAKRHKTYGKTTMKSGYGKGSTYDKAQKHFEKAQECNDLESDIAAQWD